MKLFLLQTGQLCPDYISVSVIQSLVLFSFSTVSIETADVNSCSYTIILFMLLTLIYASLTFWLTLTGVKVLNISLMFSSATSVTSVN